MSLLTAAIRAELNAEYRTAVRYYLKLAGQGSLMDRNGIFQSLARCNEKLAAFKSAGSGHERAGKGYLKLPSSVMDAQERSYYSLLGFRSAVQDYTSGASMRRAAQGYLTALSNSLKAGKEGYSHEMLFVGHHSMKLGLLKKDAGFFNDSAAQFEQEGKLKLAR